MNDSDWSVGVKSVFAKKFKELGGKVVADESMAADERDLRAQIVKIMAGEPELVYFPSHPEAGSIGIRQIREMGLSVPILGGDMWDEGMLQKIGKIAEGVQFTVTAEATLPTQFLNAVRDKLGNDEMNVYGPRAYDAVKILASIINKVGYDADKIKAELYKIKNYHGIADTYTIDKNGDVSSASYDVKEFRNGKLSTVN